MRSKMTLLDCICAISVQTENLRKVCQFQEANINESHTFLTTPLSSTHSFQQILIEYLVCEY